MDFFHNEISCSFHILDAAVPPAPVATACWMLPLAADPAVALASAHACMHALIREHRRLEMSDIISGDVASCSASGATSFTCAHCQASPAALVDAPSSGAPLSSLDQSIWSNVHGVMNFRVHVLLRSMFFHAFRDRSPECWCKGQNVSAFLLVDCYAAKQHTTMFYT